MNTFISPLDNNKNNNEKNWGQVSRRANARASNLATRFLRSHLSRSNCTVSEVSGQSSLNNQHNSPKFEWSLAGWASAILRQKRYRLQDQWKIEKNQHCKDQEGKGWIWVCCGDPKRVNNRSINFEEKVMWNWLWREVCRFKGTRKRSYCQGVPCWTKDRSETICS